MSVSYLEGLLEGHIPEEYRVTSDTISLAAKAAELASAEEES